MSFIILKVSTSATAVDTVVLTSGVTSTGALIGGGTACNPRMSNACEVFILNWWRYQELVQFPFISELNSYNLLPEPDPAVVHVHWWLTQWSSDPEAHVVMLEWQSLVSLQFSAATSTTKTLRCIQFDRC